MPTQQERIKKFKHWMLVGIYLMIYDVIAFNLSYFFGLLLRYDLMYSRIPIEYLVAFRHFAPLYTVFSLVLFWALRLYNSVWRFASVAELSRIVVANIISSLFQVLGMSMFVGAMPVSYFVFGAIAQFMLVTTVRFMYRFVNLLRARNAKNRTAKRKAMIIGAGSAGQMLIHEMLQSERYDARPVCIIDDNPNKWNRFIHSVPIVGGRDDILSSAEKYEVDIILFAVPSASAEEKRDILNICKETDCELQSLPGIYQLANGEVLLSKMKPVAVEDLLGREPIKVNMDEIYQQITGKTVLVTGGGGSIGSELCRQVAAHNPKQLVILDIYENNAYDIQQELIRKYGDSLNLVTLIGSVRDSRRMDMIFRTYRPDIVYHAAAHKHVPLMEVSPCESIKNNVVGTYKTAFCAMKYGTERFVLISTDKAVNPTNIMGASKRLCEMTIQSMDEVSSTGRYDLLPLLSSHLCHQVDSDPMELEYVDGGNLAPKRKTRFVAVRFGNVLGSNGSVIPLFKKQIEAGGPVTVTHPDIIRYFMTIPEAVSLVMQAGTYAHGGEIFVLDMGAPVKIDSLARNLIRLSGYTLEEMPIVYTGLRPGEKLFEEKLMAEEGMRKTDNDLIHIGSPIPFNTEHYFQKLEVLAKAGYNNDPDIVEYVKDIVLTFHPVGDKPTGEENKDSIALTVQLAAMAAKERELVTV